MQEQNKQRCHAVEPNKEFIKKLKNIEYVHSHEDSAQGRWRDVKDLKDHVSHVKRQLTVDHWRVEIDTLKKGAGPTQNS